MLTSVLFNRESKSSVSIIKDLCILEEVGDRYSDWLIKKITNGYSVISISYCEVSP